MYVIYGITYNCFGFWGCELSIERVVAHSPLFFIFPRHEMLAAMELRKVACCYSMLPLSNIMKFQYVTFNLSLGVL